MRLAAFDADGTMTRVALELGASAALKDSSGRTALAIAIARRNAVTTTLLRAGGAPA